MDWILAIIGTALVAACVALGWQWRRQCGLLVAYAAGVGVVPAL